MTTFTATLTPMLTLFACIAAGFILYKCKILPDSAGKTMAKTETRIFCPALNFMTMAYFCTPDAIGEHFINIILSSLGVLLERSGTSIGANIREAKYDHSKADFVAKLQISLKECYETEYWIEIAQKANIISEDIAKSVLHDCGSIRRMLIASINTAKESAK